MTSYRNRHRTAADLDIGLALATARVHARLTQTAAAEALARLTGAPWSQVAVSNVETGRTPATVSQVVLMTLVYNAPDPFNLTADEVAEHTATTVAGTHVRACRFTEPCLELAPRDEPAPRYTE